MAYCPSNAFLVCPFGGTKSLIDTKHAVLSLNSGAHRHFLTRMKECL